MAAASRELTFVDTNVLVYAHDAGEREKQPIARTILEALWADGTGVLSTQVLQEFYAVVTGNQAIGMRPADAREVIALYSTWPVVVVDPVLIVAATELHERRSISFWDALIVAAARHSGATRLMTEDLGDGNDIDGIQIVNPFRAAAG